MSVNTADGARHVTRADWEALREQCQRAMAESAQLRAEARQSQSHAVEQRLLRAEALASKRSRPAAEQHH